MDASTAIERAQNVADSVLFPRAQDVDRGTVPPHAGLHALASAGLFGIAGPASHGGSDLDALGARRVIAAIGSGCGATFFVWVQHLGVVRSVRASENGDLVDTLLAPMCAGDLVAGVAFAHARRLGAPAVTATPLADGGWRLDGHAPWVTSWGIADWFCVAAESAAGELVWSMIPASGSAGIDGHAARPPGVLVDRHRRAVVRRMHDPEGTRRHDRERRQLARRRSTPRPRSASRPCSVSPLVRFASCTIWPARRTRPGRLDAELDATWSRDDELVGADPGSDIEAHIASASDHRAACLDLARRATTALLAATGGRGMDLAHPAQRLAREADFYVIQAQTADGRAATLRSV